MQNAQQALKTVSDAYKALRELRGFIGASQLQAIGEAARGEEKQFFFEKVVELAEIVRTMPMSYQTDGQGDKAVALLHYFKGSADWYITEKDVSANEKDEDGNPEGQMQAFGLANLGVGDGPELGYISIKELISYGVELDMYFKPMTLGDIKAMSSKG